jgi:predicted small lipoprotein YifL
MNIRRLLALCSLVALASCGSQNPPPANSSAQQPQASPAPAQSNASIYRHNGCTIDFAKVCQSYIDQPQFTYNGDEYDWTRFQQSFSRHPDIEIWGRYPDGSVVADIECHVETQTRKINWARLLPNPPLTDKAWAYAKSQRWCQEDSPDYSGWTAYWSKENTHQ